MGFERFGVVSFTAQTKAAPFVEHLEKGVVAGTQCKRCGAIYFPPRADCASCFSSDMAWKEVTGKGKLLSYSKLIYAPTGFEADLPYSIALAEFPNGMKVFGRLSKEIRDEDIGIGIGLTCEVIRLPNDRLTYEFKKA